MSAMSHLYYLLRTRTLGGLVGRRRARRARIRRYYRLRREHAVRRGRIAQMRERRLF